jgi:hypothetical protein
MLTGPAARQGIGANRDILASMLRTVEERMATATSLSHA